MRPPSPAPRLAMAALLAAATLPLAGCVVVVGNEFKEGSEHRNSHQGRIGVELAPPGETLSSHLGIERARASVITRVRSGSPAERAGLQRHDIITRVGDSDDASVERVRAAASKVKAGEDLHLTVRRAGEPLDVVVTLDSAGPSAGLAR